MTINLSSLIGAIAALLGSMYIITVGVIVAMRRSESSSLFVEDRREYAAAKLIIGGLLALVGFSLAHLSIERLLSLY